MCLKIVPACFLIIPFSISEGPSGKPFFSLVSRNHEGGQTNLWVWYYLMVSWTSNFPTSSSYAITGKRGFSSFQHVAGWLKGQCHEMECQLRPLTYSLGLNISCSRYKFLTRDFPGERQLGGGLFNLNCVCRLSWHAISWVVTPSL
jgi:hypothetical protein